MLASMKRAWWVILLRGILAILFGALAIIWPGLTLLTLILIYAAYALVDGGFTAYAALQSRTEDNRWWIRLLEGGVGIIAGIVAFIAPLIAGFVLLLWIAVWAILTGITQMTTAYQLRKEIEGEWYLGLAGLLSILFGGFIALFPVGGALAIAWLIGLYSIMFGVLFISLALRLRNRESTSEDQQQQGDPYGRATA